MLSPRPRIGELQERIGWFATYGVRECWIVRQDDQTVEVLSFAEGTISARRAFGALTSVRSEVLTLAMVLSA